LGFTLKNINTEIMGIANERINLTEIDGLVNEEGFLNNFEDCGFEIVDSEFIEVDLEKQEASYLYIIRRESDNKLFKAQITDSLSGLFLTDNFAQEVFPQQRTITVYV